MSRRNQIWIGALVSLALAQLVASLVMRRGESLIIVSDLIQGTLLLLATLAFLPKALRPDPKSPHTRLFWVLMTSGMIFWLAYQAMWNYFEVIKRTEVPDPFLGDVVLFLHLVPMIAALAVLPHLRQDERNERIRMLDFSLLLTWWLFLYAYLVIPWQTIQIDEPTYSANFNFAYLTEKIVWLLGLALLAYSAHGAWRILYAQFLGAGALYAGSSYVAVWAIGHKIYYSGSIFDIPLTVSIAWIASVPILAERYDLSESNGAKPLLSVWITRLGMLALFSLPWVALYAALDSGQPGNVRELRITMSLLAMVIMGVMVFWRQRMLRAELSYFLEQSRNSFDELKTLQAKLIQSEKLASLGQLVGGAAHEINNPLTAMLGYSDLLAASKLPADEQKLAANIGEQVRRTKTLVGSLLTFARPAAANLTSIDVNSVLQTGLRLMSSQLQGKGLRLRLELSNPLALVLADSNQLLHVSLHLVGQITSHIEGGSESEIVVRTHRDGDAVVVDFLRETVATEPQMFDAPLSSDGTIRPETLSLNACCRIIEEHGGRLLLTSKARMAAFRVELPVASQFTGVPAVRTAGFPRAAGIGI